MPSTSVQSDMDRAADAPAGSAAPSHAPGPWTVEVYGDGDSLVIHSDEDNRVCFMATPGSRGDFQRIKANAFLIAAAPDLADAARKTVDGLAEEYRITADHDDEWVYDTLGSVLADVYFVNRAALAKALPPSKDSTHARD